VEIERTGNDDLKQELQSLIEDSQKKKEVLNNSPDKLKLIDLSHRVIIILDTPQPDLFNALMSLLSHDKYKVDTYHGIKTKRNVLWGWPAMVYSQAIVAGHKFVVIFDIKTCFLR
jgi:hypothetical protein